MVYKHRMEAQDNNKNNITHGGDLTAATKEFGMPVRGWIDLSTGINPVNFPDLKLKDQLFHKLPTSGQTTNLLKIASDFYQVSTSMTIIASPGTQAVLQHMPRLYPKRKVAILSPTYSEYENTWSRFGNQIIRAGNLQELKQGNIAVVVNPNNPDGRRHQIEDLIELAEHVETLILDETFCDHSSEVSIIPKLHSQNIIVLRSIGKFFGLAGLRLGFVISNANITDNIEKMLGPWAVSGPAIEIGTRALSDKPWIEKMDGILSMKSRELDNLLIRQNLKILGKTVLFKLIENNNAQFIYQTLAKSGILVRKFNGQKNWLRIGLPGIKSEWLRLEAILHDCSNAINDMSK